MGEPAIFPIELRARENEHFTESPYHYQSAFRAAYQPSVPRRTYYAYDVILRSRVEAEFVAYDMRDTVYGGIGKEIWRGRGPVDASVTAADIDRKILRLAIDRRGDELAAAEQVIIQRYADEIRASLDTKDSANA